VALWRDQDTAFLELFSNGDEDAAGYYQDLI
jgi:hypothetical protein